MKREDDYEVLKTDNRLFPEYPLYCEGLDKPVLRGFAHLCCALILPLGMYHLMLEANGNILGMIVAFLYTFSNIWCYGISALYHVGNWSARTEIFLQKLDHCGIAVLSCGTMLPVSVLLLSPLVGGIFTVLSVGTCIWACWNIMNLRPSVVRLAIVASVLMPFIPFCFVRMNTIEFTTMLLTYVFQSIGMSIFINKFPDPWPSIHGYHELFHIFVIIAGICVYLCNWSVIRRTCNPYAHRTEIVEILHLLWHSITNTN